MPLIVVSVLIDASLAAVWAELSDLERHAEWMADVRWLRFTTPQRRGPGTTLDVMTRLGPLHTVDVLEVTRWDELHAMEVVHRGTVQGWGRFELTPLAGVTRVSWSERLRFPWWLGGRFTSTLARPVLAVVWHRNLERLRTRVEGRLNDR